jgi:phage replication O-like protein O
MPKGDREILKADPEDGTTPIANLLLEAIGIAKLTGREKGILLLLCRKTYGWQENGKRLKETSLSIGNCAKALEIDQRTAQKLLAGLAEKKIVSRDFSKPGYGYTYSINTRVGEWDIGCINHQLLAILTRGGLITNTRVGQNTKGRVDKNTNTPKAELASPKENIKERDVDIELLQVRVSGEERRVTAVELWQLVLADLKQQVSAANYRTWLEKSVALGTRDGVFVVGAPPGGAAEYLAQNQRSLIERTLAQYLGDRIKVKFVLRQPDVMSP